MTYIINAVFYHFVLNFTGIKFHQEHTDYSLTIQLKSDETAKLLNKPFVN